MGISSMRETSSFGCTRIATRYQASVLASFISAALPQLVISVVFMAIALHRRGCCHRGRGSSRHVYRLGHVKLAQMLDAFWLGRGSPAFWGVARCDPH